MRSASTPGEVCALLAAILAHGCNLGLYTMEKVAPAIAYRRLKYVSDWRLVEENQRAALAAIVHGISRLDARRPLGTRHDVGQRRAALRHAAQRSCTSSSSSSTSAMHEVVTVALYGVGFTGEPVTTRGLPHVKM